MSIESDLKKDAIRVISKLDTLVVNNIARNIARKIVATFPELNFDETNLFIKLSRIDMYTASMPDGMAEANYFYKNSSVYFNNRIDLEDLEEFAIHECIHHLQEIKTSRNKLVRMGLCTFNTLSPIGIGINEAAVQLITSKIIGIKPDFVKYYGIEFKSSSPSYYPMECHLVEEMAFVTGYDILYESTFNSNNNFKNTFIKSTSEKVFLAIQGAIDSILKYEEEISKLTSRLGEENKSGKACQNINKKINELKQKISLTFMRTQNLIISSYFDNSFLKITNLEELDNYRKKLEKFRSLVCTQEGYFFFDNYYIEKMCALEHKCNILENGGIETAVTVTKTNKFLAFLVKLKNLFKKESHIEF